jgi:hypothetical protein
MNLLAKVKRGIESGKFTDFKGWADGYAALTYDSTLSGLIAGALS